MSDGKLVMIYASGSENPQLILDSIPSSRYFKIIDSTTTTEAGTGGSKYTKYHALILTVEEDAHVWGYMGGYRVLRPFYPRNGRDGNVIYWKGVSPKPFVTSFLKAGEYSKELVGDITYTDKGTYGFIKFPETFGDLPILMSGLITTEPSGSHYNYAFIANGNESRNDVRLTDKFGPQSNAEIKNTHHENHFKGKASDKRDLPRGRGEGEDRVIIFTRKKK